MHVCLFAEAANSFYRQNSVKGQCDYAVITFALSFEAQRLSMLDEEKIRYLLSSINSINLENENATLSKIFYRSYANLTDFWYSVEMEEQISRASNLGFIKIKETNFWELTEAGRQFLSPVINDNIGDMKWLLNRIKASASKNEIYNDLNKNFSVVHEAVRLGLIVNAGDYWGLTEFGEEFLLEAGNDD